MSDTPEVYSKSIEWMYANLVASGGLIGAGVGYAVGLLAPDSVWVGWAVGAVAGFGILKLISALFTTMHFDIETPLTTRENDVLAKECDLIADYLEECANSHDGPLASHLAMNDRVQALVVRNRARHYRGEPEQEVDPKNVPR